MTELVYYVAASIDGYIADSEGGVAFLDVVEDGSDHGYHDFFAAIDSLIMGGATYRWLQSYGQWPYGERPCWVLTRREHEAMAETIRFDDRGPAEVLAEIEQLGLGRTWLIGGGELAGSFRREGLIDEYWITWIPYVLGEGIPLFGVDKGGGEKLRLVSFEAYPSGALQARYESH